MNQTNLEGRWMPLRRAVFSVTGEAAEYDDQEIRKAVRRWHNRLANGSVPRSIFRKIGKELFIDLLAFDNWINRGHTQNKVPRRQWLPRRFPLKKASNRIFREKNEGR